MNRLHKLILSGGGRSPCSGKVGSVGFFLRLSSTGDIDSNSPYNTNID